MTNNLQRMFHGGKSSDAQHLKDTIDQLLKVNEEDVEYDLDDRKSTEFKVRCSPKQLETWRRAADVEGVTASQWVRQMADEKAREILVCSHPESAIIRYAWAATCTKCGTRIG